MNTLTLNHAYKPSAVLNKWQLLALISAVLLLMAIAFLALNPNLVGVRQVIRATARTSLLLFCVAFIASSANRRYSSRFTHWIRLNRRYFGLGFAVSHAIHAAAIVAFAVLDTETFDMTSSVGSRISGSIGYIFIVLMAATSFDRTAAWLGARSWKILHTAGVYYIWVSFVIAFGKRIPVSPLYFLPIALLMIVLIVRLWPKQSRVLLA